MSKKNFTSSVLVLVKSVATNDVVVRAFKTFLQAFVAVLVATDVPLSKQALVAAIAAGVSAAYNTVKQFIKK